MIRKKAEEFEKRILTASDDIRKTKATEDMFLLMDKYIQEEAKLKAKGIYEYQDVLQSMYLEFMQTVKDVKDNLLNTIIERLNKFIPSKEYQKQTKYGKTISLDTKIFKGKDGDSLTIASTISQDDKAKPLSKLSPEEIEQSLTQVKTISSGLTQREQKVVEERSKGLFYKDIAKSNDTSEGTERIHYLIAIAKLQQEHGVLPREYTEKAKQLKRIFETDKSIDELITILIKNPVFYSMSVAKMKENSATTSHLLEIEEKEFIKAVLKQPSLLYQKPESIKQNIERSSQLLEIEEKEFIKATLRQPSLLTQKPETLKQKIERSSQLLEIEEKEFIKAALRQPSLLTQKPETLKQKIEKSSQLLGIKEKEFIKVALRQPTSFLLKPETLKQNTETAAKLLGIEEKEFIKVALQQPQLFFQKPETIKQNVKTSSQLLGIKETDFIKITSKQPSLLAQKPETIKENIEKTSKLLGIEETKLIKTALRHPQLLQRKTETLKQNLEKSSQLLEIEEKEFIQAVLKQPSLLMQKPETLKQNVEKSSRLLEITEKEFIQAGLRQPSLFFAKPETLKQNIEKSSNLLGITEKEFIQAALKQPQLFCLKSETILKKIKLNNYYRKLENKIPVNTIYAHSDSCFYDRILVVLINHKTNRRTIKINDKERIELEQFIINNPDINFEFDIPEDELVVPGLIEYANELSQKLLKRNAFHFNIIK